MPDLALATFRAETTRQLTTFDLEKRSKTIAVPHGQKVSLPVVTGPGVITQFWITFPGWFWAHWEPHKPTSQALLKTLIVRIYWDGSDRPAVSAPAADFFGNGLAEACNFTAQRFGMSSGGFFCKWPMPFRRSFRIEFENLHETIDTDVFANVLYQLGGVPSDVGYFHTQFRAGSNPGPQPVDILEANGRGHFVGCTLAMQGRQPRYLSFLEAPEYVFIDDDWEKPRVVGTGLEDYFLGGWYFREGIFTGEKHGVPAKDPLRSSVAMYRIHDDDAIHFARRIRFQFINPWDAEKLKPFVYSSAAFFYLDSPQGTGTPLPSRADLLAFRIRDTDHLSEP